MLQWVTHAKTLLLSLRRCSASVLQQTTKDGIGLYPEEAKSKLCGHKRFKTLPTSKLFCTLHYISQGHSQGLSPYQCVVGITENTKS